MRRRRKPLPAPRRDAGGRSRASSAVESVLGFGGGVLIARAPRRTDPDARRSDTSFQTTRSISREGVRKSSGLPVGARLVRGSRIGRRGSRAARPAHPRARRTPAARTVAHRPTVVDLLDAPPAMAPPGGKHVTFSEPTKGGRGGLRRVPTGGKGTLTAAAKVAAEAGTSSADTLEVRTSVLSASLHRSRRSTERRCDGRGANARGRPGDRGPPSV